MSLTVTTKHIAHCWDMKAPVAGRESRCEHYQLPESYDISKEKINVNSIGKHVSPHSFVFF